MSLFVLCIASTKVVEEIPTDDSTLVVHLGVDARATSFKLEQRAYNNMTFRVPDEQVFRKHLIDARYF